jgi:hypothetical protein
MNSQTTGRRAIVVIALLCSFLLLHAGLAYAKDKPKKARGVIAKIDHEKRVMVLSKPNTDKRDITVEWIENVEMKPKSKTVADLKEGIYVRCMINDEGKARTIRIYPEVPDEHKPKE